MTIRWGIQSGGEYLIPFAKRMAERQHLMMRDSGLTASVRDYLIDSNTTIHIESLMVGSGLLANFVDKVRITAGGGWDFYLQDPEFFGTQRADIYFGKVGKPGLRKVSMGRLSINVAPFASRKDAHLMFFDPAAGWRQIDKNQKVSAYAPSSFGGSVVTPTPTSEDTKMVAIITNGANVVLTDGVNYVAVTSVGLGTLYVAAIKTDGFFVSQGLDTSSGFYLLKLVSLAESLRKDTFGNFINPSGILQDAILHPPVSGSVNAYSPILNYTDIFSLVTLTDSLGVVVLKFYRGGVLGYTSTSLLGAPSFNGCSKDSVSSYVEAGSSTGTAFIERILVINGKRRDDGIYVFSELTVTLDTLVFANGTLGGYNGPINAIGYSDARTVLFSSRIRQIAFNTFEFYTYSIDALGNKTELAGFPYTYADAIAFGFGVGFHAASVRTVGFNTKSCVLGACSTALYSNSWCRTIFFYFSDGTSMRVILPNAARDLSISQSAASKTVAYVYLIDGGIKYLIDSLGGLRVLPDPTRLAADGVTIENPTSIASGAFIDQKEGCALIFEASWATAPFFTVHHWKEDGTIFNYARPALTYAVFALLGVPTATPLQRMELIEFWGP